MDHIDVAYLWFILICVTWGSSFILMKKAGLALSPIEVAAWRVICGAAVLGVLCWWHRAARWLNRNDVGWMVFVVLIGYAWPFAIQPHLIQRHGSAFIGLTVSFVPLLTILVSVPMLRLWPSRRQVVGVLGAILFMGLLMWDGLDRAVPIGDLFLAGTVPLGYAISNTAIRRWLSHIPSLTLAFQSLIVTGLILMPLMWISPGPIAPSASVRSLAFLSVGILGVLGTGIATFLFTKLIHEQGPLFAGMVTNISPVGAVLWGWADAEHVSRLQVVALVGIVLMVTIVQFGAARRATQVG